MKIDSGPMANCSELVAKLYTESSEKELHKVLHKLERATGWKVGIEAGGKFMPEFERPEKRVRAELMGETGESREIHRGVKIEDVQHGTGEDEGEIVYPTSNLSEPLRSFFHQNSYADGPFTFVQLLPNINRVDQTRNMKRFSSVDGMMIEHKDGYCSSGRVMLAAFQHSYKPHFEPLARAIRDFNGSFHVHDGGSPGSFKTWCKNNGFKDVASKEEW